jgi:hypothetical protein
LPSSNPMVIFSLYRRLFRRLGRACHRHTRLSCFKQKTWMPGTRPGMTKSI